jgi:4-alpha-glucanotransferase
MALGLYTDMAVGSIASGFDAWAFPGSFVGGASLGAPPDPYSATGQNWALPPLNPHVLRAQEYRYWRAMLKAAFRHCGMLRIDHAMGVLRQFWNPDGCSGTGGAYVRFPADDLLALLALESRASAAVVVAEDLGTVPEGFGDLLDRYGILSSNVMFFIRSSDGGFVAPARYSKRALLTANTHDQPTLAGWWQGGDLEIRRRVGMIESDGALEAARTDREREKDLLVRRLRAARALEGTGTGRDARARARAAAGVAPFSGDEAPALSAAVNAYLAAAPSPLLGVSLDDLAAETEPVNVPGVGVERYPSWSRRMRLALEDIASDAGVAKALAGVASRTRTRRGRKTQRAMSNCRKGSPA